MALSSEVLSALIRARLVTYPWCTDNEELTQLCDAIAVSVVSHVVAAAVVNPTGLLAPSGGGAVTGAGSIT